MVRKDKRCRGHGQVIFHTSMKGTSYCTFFVFMRHVHSILEDLVTKSLILYHDINWQTGFVVCGVLEFSQSNHLSDRFY